MTTRPLTTNPSRLTYQRKTAPQRAALFGDQLVLTIRQAADIQGVTTSAIHQRIDRGTLKAYRIENKQNSEYFITAVDLALSFHPATAAKRGRPKKQPTYTQFTLEQEQAAADIKAVPYHRATQDERAIILREIQVIPKKPRKPKATP